MMKKILSLILIIASLNSYSAEKVLVIGFDGCRRERFKKLISEKKMPNVVRLMQNGQLIDSFVSIDATETKPGWTQVFTGYTSKVTGVFDNLRYQPIPKGLSVFNRLKEKFGKDIYQFFLTGKINNTGARGPHIVCINCKTRFDDTRVKTNWWEANPNAPLSFGTKQILQKRDGEPYFTSLTSLDKYQSSIPSSDEVTKEAILQLEKAKTKYVFGFIHFEQPDEKGHIFGENSKEYQDALLNNDKQLGKILDFLEKNKNYKDVKIILTTDHGFKENGKGHGRKSEEIWLVSNFKSNRKTIDRLDVAPTVYELFNIDPKTYTPAIEGKSIL